MGKAPAQVRFLKHAYCGGAGDFAPGDIGTFNSEACENFVREGIATYDLTPAPKFKAPQPEPASAKPEPAPAVKATEKEVKA
jgi:hypothetical protein